jgi:membrane protein required for colicin V production
MIAGGIIGLKKGLIWQVATILGLIVGFTVAKHLYAYIAEKYISSIANSLTIAQIVVFIGIWLIVPIVFSLAGALLTKIINAALLGCFNRALGAVLGVVKYTFLIGVMIHILDQFDSGNHIIPQNKKDTSTFYYPLKEFAGMILPAIKELKQRTIFEQQDESTRRKA